MKSYGNSTKKVMTLMLLFSVVYASMHYVFINAISMAQVLEISDNVIMASLITIGLYCFHGIWKMWFKEDIMKMMRKA